MINIFQFLENKKGKPIPFEYKLLYNMPLTQDELIYNDTLNLYNSNIISLPNNLTVDGNLFLNFSDISFLPNNLIVNHNLFINNTNISDLPDNLYVGSDLWCRTTPLAERTKNDTSLLNKYSKQVKGRIWYAI